MPILVTTATLQRSKPRPSCARRRGRPRTPPRPRPDGAARCGRSGAAAVPAVYAPAFDIDAVGAGHADPLAVAGEDAADQAGGRSCRWCPATLPPDAGIFPGSNIMETMACPRCGPCRRRETGAYRRPGRVHLDNTAALSSRGLRTESQTTSMPQMSRPTVCAAATAQAASSGWTSSVTSVAVPPVGQVGVVAQDEYGSLAGPNRRSVPAERGAPGRCQTKRIWPSAKSRPFAADRTDDSDQLTDGGVLAVADHLWRFAPGGGDMFYRLHDQEAPC